MAATGRWWRGMALLVLVAIGALWVTTARLANGTDLRAERRTDLTGLISEQESQVAAASERLAQLQAQVDETSQRLDASRTAEQLDLTRQVTAAAGLSEVTGPGLSVTLDDAPVPESGIPDGFAPDDYVVHQSDLQSVVNALWAGGAQAVAVMDQRIIATSAVRCVGNTLILKGRVYAPPYTVTAVGRSDRMVRALDAAPGVIVYRQYADLIGLGYDVKASDEVVVPAYEGPLALSFAEPSA